MAQMSNSIPLFYVGTFIYGWSDPDWWFNNSLLVIEAQPGVMNMISLHNAAYAGRRMFPISVM